MATLLAILLIGGIAYARGGVLYNPGELNAQAGAQPLGGVSSHSEIGGRCAACHTAFWEQDKMADRCLSCHVDLNASADNFHRVMLAQSQTWECFQCHTDHRGSRASLTVMDLERFPHQAIGFSLQGHHLNTTGASFTCSDCHGDDISRFEETACTGCHRQIDPAFMEEHLNSFGQGCLACHDGIDTYGESFDHNNLAFPLQGEHAAADCSGCHTGARMPEDLRQTPQACFSCHAEDDAHQGRFGQDCQECHTPDGWEGASFDHSLAAFPLTGAHAQVECEGCHVNDVFKGTPQACFSCHADDDAHQGRFGQDCQECHTPEDGWEGASFDHSLAAFQLSGAHAQVECEGCHVNDVFKGTPQDCFSCHAEPAYHIGLFGAECAACHSTDGWKPAAFNQAHTFPFNHGGSEPSECRVCHAEALTSYTCYTCHEHNPAQIESKHREEGISDFRDCARCHPTGQEEEGEGGGGDD